MNRKISLLNEEISNLLKRQLNHELENFLLYKEFAAYFANIGLIDLEKYYIKRADEEKTHYEWIFKYLSEADCVIKHNEFSPLKDNNVESIIDPFIKTLDKEIETTTLIYEIYEKALELKDFMTITWLQSLLIKEQIEEENISRVAKTIIELEGDILIKSKQILNLLSYEKN